MTRVDETSTDVIPVVPTLEVAGIALTVIEGPDRGLRHEIAYGRARVGTSESSSLRLTDPTVSRMHCEIQVRTDALRIVDSGSTNGTVVDGVRVADATLAPGANVRLGATVLRVDADAEPVRLQLSVRQNFGELVGGSIEMRRVFAVLERVSPTESTLLLQGETGTGKDLVARAVHSASKRAGAPFVPVDCGAIAENLIESELFGHTRGAFTGASADRKGLFEQAHGGTLFLDEVGELPMALQPKLLRALETRTIRRVGGSVPQPIDIRVIAATHRNLAESVNRGTFREDLYFRLAVVEIALPPLRARCEDIPMLAQHLLEHLTGETALLPAAFVTGLLTRSWPGNVRELRNLIERTVSWAVSIPSRVPQMHPPTPRPPCRRPWTMSSPSTSPLKDARRAWSDRFERACT